MSTVFISAITLSYLLPGGLTPRQSTARGLAASPLVARSRPIFAFDDGQREETLERGSPMTLWENLDNLSYRDVVTPDDPSAIAPADGQIVAVHFTATNLASGNVIDSTGDRPLTFRLGDDSEPLFQEAISGMKVGGKRRLNLKPGSKYASPLAKETIQFEVELVGIQTGADAVIFNVQRNWNSVFNAAILLTFAPDVLAFLGLLPAPDGTTQLNNIFNMPGFGQIDILSDAAASSAASAPAVVDAANQWAAQGLQGLM